MRKYHYSVPGPLDVEAIRSAAELLTGTWDYQSFCAAKRTKKSTVRTIYEIAVTQEGEDILLTFHGNGFLYNMVRILSGTLIEVGLGKRLPQSMREILKARDRSAAGFTAPAQGLCLTEVRYD